MPSNRPEFEKELQVAERKLTIQRQLVSSGSGVPRGASLRLLRALRNRPATATLRPAGIPADRRAFACSSVDKI